MSNSNPPTASAHRRKRFRISPVWLIPIIVILIGCWLLYQNYLAQGPMISVILDNAEGVEANKTPVKVRDVQVGQVTSVRLTDDYDHAVAVIQMNNDTKKLLAKDSSFWVVKPRIGRHGISGLNTILSGAYIQMQPGQDTKMSTKFKALDHPPVTSSSTPGTSILLYSQSDTALHVGDPITYQGQSVGTIETATFSAEDNRMKYRAFIRSPFSKIVNPTTQFWVNSGIDLHIGASGIEVRTGSLQSIFSGGVTFSQPEDIKPKPAVNDGAKFTLFATQTDANEQRFDRKIPYLVLLNESVRGLNEGSPVLFRGIRIGTVKAVPYFFEAYNSKKHNHRIPVLIQIEPQRVKNWMNWDNDKWREQLKNFFDKGLRARLQTANLFTGAQLIDLHYTHDAKPYTPEKIGDYEVFPSAPGAISDLQQQASKFLRSLNEAQIPKVSQDIEKTLQQLQDTLSDYGQDTPFYHNLERSLRQLQRVLDQLEPLSKQLKEDPSSIIFGPSPDQDPIPKAADQ